MATPRKRRPSFDVPAPATPEASAWAYRTDPTAPATPPAPPVRTVSCTSTSTPVSSPSVLTRLVAAPVMVIAMIVLMPLTWIARPSKPR